MYKKTKIFNQQPGAGNFWVIAPRLVNPLHANDFDGNSSKIYSFSQLLLTQDKPHLSLRDY